MWYQRYKMKKVKAGVLPVSYTHLGSEERLYDGLKTTIGRPCIPR